MNIDLLAKQTHRRGFLAAIAALAIPAAAGAQQVRCSPRGGGCTLSIDCCGDITCYRQPLNPNSGVCGIEPDDDDAPIFLIPSTSDDEDEDDESDSSGRAAILAEYDRNSDGDLDCRDFICWDDAQAFLRRYPNDPFNLDGNADGEACEHLPRC